MTGAAFTWTFNQTFTPYSPSVATTGIALNREPGTTRADTTGTGRTTAETHTPGETSAGNYDE